MKKLKFPVAALAASMFLTACGGGGNAGGNPATGIIDLGGNPSVDNRPATDNTLSLEGVAADGYLVGATVCLDLNSNLSCDSAEPSATTGAGGVFSIDATQAQIDSNSLVLVASPSTTTDEDTDAAVAGDFVLTAPAGSTFISPITTLVQARIRDGETAAAAASAVESELGISDYAADYIAANDDATHRVAQALTRIQIDAVAEFNAVGDGSGLGNILNAMVEVVQAVVTAAADSSASIADIAQSQADVVSALVSLGGVDGEIISGNILSDMTLTADRSWVLDGVVTVGAGNVTVNNDADVSGIKDAGVTLTIEAGTDVRATSDGVLIVTRGSKIMAEGTAAAPITFSSVDEGYDGLGEWGGVVIQGFAPQYGAGGTGACFGDGTVCNVEGEGGTAVAVYGGNDPTDNSGVMRYVRIAEGGLVAGPDNEVNGLTLQGVGHGTTLEYIQVHNNLDDGIEWFGGTVNAKWVVLTNNDDDSLDYDEGYQGNIQFAIIRMSQQAAAPQGSNDPRGIEANSSNAEFVQETNATLANALLIGGQINDGEPGMRLRGALTTGVYNSAVRGFTRSCVRIDNAEVAGTTINSKVTLMNIMGDCEDGFFHNDNRPINEFMPIEQPFTLTSAFAIADVEAQLGSRVAPAAVDNGSGFVFESTDYIGAVAPGTSQANAWWSGWIIEGSLGEDPVSQTFPDFVDCSADGCTQTATVSGTIAEDYRFTSNLQWILEGVVRVGQGNVTLNSDTDVQAIKAAGVTLTIEAGTDVRARGDGTLLVTRGSKIMAEGTRTAPITFSSEDDGYDGLGEWGGVVIQGFAPQYGAGGTGACFGDGTVCNVAGEGGTKVAVYGGNDEADDSGILRYVRIAEGGLVAGPDNEVNGLTLQGVGYGTTLEYIQVHNNLDDGVEWFGGTVNARWLVLTNNDDDSIDYDEGYVGNIQYAIIKMQQAAGAAPQGSNDPRGIEANSSDQDFVEETNAVLANISLMGGDINAGEPGMRLRGALTTSVYNTAVEGFDRSCVRVDDANVAGSVMPSNVTLVNVLGDCMSGFYHNSRAADTAINSGAHVVTFDDAFAMNEIQALLSSAPSINAVGNSGFSFDQTAYVGAVEPGTATADAWWADWTIPGSLEKETNAVDSSPGFVSCNGNACEITGDITQDYTMVAGVDWSMDGVVTVGTGNTMVNSDADVQAIKDAGVTLTIEAGVDISMASDGTLIVTRGSSIIAKGEADEPITFSSADPGYDGLGEWGGVVIQGFAPQCGAGGTGACFGSGTICNVEGEGGTAVAVYGGNEADDNSGVMRYVRIAEGGLIAGPNNELNGLTLQGVGHATDLQYIQVHNNLDDGIEWFGGTVNLKYVVLTNNDDDSLDFDEGYQGNIQHAIIRMSQTASAPQGSNDPRGVEANSSDEDFVAETKGAMANLLLIGAAINDGEPGMRLRGALIASVYNTAITGFDRSCVRIDDADVAGSTITSNVTLVNVIGNCTQGFYHGTSGEPADTETNAGAGTVTLDAAFALTNSAAQLDSAPTMTAVDNGSDFTFDSTDYIGAVKPGSDAAATWWSGWIIEGSLD